MNLISDIPDRTRMAYRVKFYIRDTNDAWVDFTDTTGTNGRDLLHSVGKISNQIERYLGALTTSVGAVYLKNNDGFFDKPFPSNLKTIDGAAASFKLTPGYQRSVVRGRECKIAVQVRIPNNITHSSSYSYGVAGVDNIIEEPLGHYFIDDIKPDVNKKRVRLNLISFDHRLQQKDASGIKDGYSWYTQRSVSFLIETIVRSEFKDIPNTYNIQKNPFFDTLDGSSSPSVLGRPPLWDGTNWIRSGKYCRAICLANVNSIGERLYLGCDNELWSYDYTTGEYTEIDTSSIPAGHEIKSIFYDSEDDILVVYAWVDEIWGLDQAETILNGWQMRCYRWAGSGSLTVVSNGMFINSFKHVIRVNAVTLYGDDQLLVGTNDYGVGAVDDGENFYIPYPQDVIIADSESTMSAYRVYNYEGQGSSTAVPDVLITPVEVDDTYFAYVNRGWCRMWNTDNGTLQYSTPLMYHIGQPYQMILGDVITATSRRNVLFFRHESQTASPDYNHLSHPSGSSWGVDWIRIVSHTPISANIDTTALPSGCNDMFPLCLCHNGSDNITYLILIKNFDDSTNSSLHRLEVTDDVFPVTLSSVRQIASSAWHCPIAMMAFPDNDGTGAEDALVIIWFHKGVSTLWGQGTYTITRCLASLLGTTSDLWNESGLKKLKTSPAPFTGLCLYGSSGIAVFAVGEGRVYTITKAGALTSKNQRPVVPEEHGLLSNMVFSSEAGFFGVSSPMLQLETFSSYRSGKYFLWRLSDQITDLIELADFEGMKKWEAIKQLSQARDGLSFFDREGNFHFVDRAYTEGTADYTFGEIGSDAIHYIKMELDYGYTKVINVAKTKIYESNYTPPELDALTLVKRPLRNHKNKNENVIPFVGYSLEQRDVERKKVYASCIQGGSTTDGMSRWKYMTIDIEIEAILAADAASSAVDFTLQSVFGGDDYEQGIHTGDYVTVVNPETGAAITRLITDVTEATDIISIGSSYGVALKKGAIIKISRGYRADDSTTPTKTIWSDEGVTYITASAAVNDVQVIVNSVSNISVGTVIRFEKESQDDDAFLTEYRITLIGEHNGTTGYPITIETIAGVTTNVVKDTLTAGDHVYAFYSPESTDGYEIGGTNIFVKWSAGSGTAGSDYINTFHHGDRLVVDCPGSSLEEEVAGLNVVVDSVSDQDHGRAEMNIDNRFMSSVVGNETSKRIVNKYAYPRYHAKLTIPLMPHVDIVTRTSGNDFKLTQVNVINYTMFPLKEGNEESFYIDAINHDTKNGITEFYFSGINAY